jgi:hypothetical protein
MIEPLVAEYVRADIRFRRVVTIDTRFATGPHADVDNTGMVRDITMLRPHSAVTWAAASGTVAPDRVGGDRLTEEMGTRNHQILRYTVPICAVPIEHLRAGEGGGLNVDLSTATTSGLSARAFSRFLDTEEAPAVGSE